MEIDFLGLSSTKHGNNQEEKNYFNDAITDTANLGVETSLSLSTRPSLYCQKDILNFSEKKKKITSDKFFHSSSGSSTSTLSSFNEQPNLLLAPPPVIRPSTTTGGFVYKLNDNSTDLRKMSEISSETATLTMLYSGCPIVLNDTLPEKAGKNSMYIAGKKASIRLSDHAGICTRTGYTPTSVAMARRATLARFLEKRFHRMNQSRTAHLMGKSLNATINSSSCDSTITRSNNNKKKNILKR